MKRHTLLLSSFLLLISVTTSYGYTVTAGNNGNPDDTFYYDSFDNEIDAVAGLTESGGGLNPIPEPGTMLLLGISFITGSAYLKRKAQ